MIVAVRFPVSWSQVGLPARPRFGPVTLIEGAPGWSWRDDPPDLPVPVFESGGGGEPAEGWEIDHLVVSTPDLSETVERLRSVGASLRRWGKATTGPAAFLRAGPVIEVIDAGDPQTRLWGLAVATRLPLAELAAAWRAAGWPASDPKPAVQPGRRLFTVRGVNLAVFDSGP